MKLSFLVLFYFSLVLSFSAQIFNHNSQYSRADTLRGSNTEFRQGWDVLHYEITVEPDFKTKSIKGTNRIKFKLNELWNDEWLQIDLQTPLEISSISLTKVEESDKLMPALPDLVQNTKREGNIYFIKAQPNSLMQNENYELIIHYQGNPKVAKNAPWDGGWVFSKDKNGNPWMSVACQGLGASVWYPCKDYQGDEPDEGAILHIITPSDLVGVGNGELLLKEETKNGKTQYSWKVKNPINNYNIIPNIGKYVNFTDSYQGEKGKLNLSYWVLDYNLEKAQNHFEVVHPMLEAFEYWMGPYPFYEDSYKLIETPYLGMEHQSGIAYGNHYKMGYLGADLSNTGVGLLWDFIIIHETGHEWYGNNITTQDVADMWVQEGFTAYSETLFTEHAFNQEKAFEYCIGTKLGIQNDIPIQGPYGVNQEGSGDMYYKAANMIHTLRMLMEDDEKFRQMLRDMNSKFYHQTVTGKQIEDFISTYTGIDLTAFFEQYLRTTQIPELHFSRIKGNIYYQYKNTVEDFDMPVRLIDGKWIYPTQEPKKLKGYQKKPAIDPNFLVNQK